ncbi:hypothetical protein [Paenibacillus periandrae]|uniref:hypothetical protein n=1 Tax=Paenibacillus periandrae TaxID=1761741 RepID=UPI001F098775|nr:hypothetical protein [Paenibacillus periandrae]
MNNKSVTVSVRVPKHLKQTFDLLKERGHIQETMSQLMLKGLEEKVEDLLKSQFTPAYTISPPISIEDAGIPPEKIIKKMEELS